MQYNQYFIFIRFSLPLYCSMLATDKHLMSSWTSGTDETWSYLQRDFSSLQGKFGSLVEKSHHQSRRETAGFTESVNLFLDLITSYQDLCERREKLVHRKHQKALGKVQTMVKHKEKLESTGRHMVCGCTCVLYVHMCKVHVCVFDHVCSFVICSRKRMTAG